MDVLALFAFADLVPLFVLVLPLEPVSPVDSALLSTSSAATAAVWLVGGVAGVFLFFLLILLPVAVYHQGLAGRNARRLFGQILNLFREAIRACGSRHDVCLCDASRSGWSRCEKCREFGDREDGTAGHNPDADGDR